MGKLTQRDQKIYTAFQRYVKSEDSDPSIIEAYGLEELIKCNLRIGPRDLNAEFRLAMQHRIEELQEGAKQEIASRRHRQQIGLAVLTIIVVLITWWFS